MRRIDRRISTAKPPDKEPSDSPIDEVAIQARIIEDLLLIMADEKYWKLWRTAMDLPPESMEKTSKENRNNAENPVAKKNMKLFVEKRHQS